MLDLSTRTGVREMLARHSLTAKKKLGQHFLVDKHVMQKVIAAADITPGEAVLEIGPGIGSMTQALAAAGAQITAVELDSTFVPVLRTNFGDAANIIHGDILQINLRQALPAHGKIKVVANLPYYITTPVIFHLLQSGIDFSCIIIMIQKEVAQRMSALPSTKAYGSLSLAVQYRADVSLVANVPVNSFMPRPAVDSAVVKLSLLDKPRVDADEEILFDLIHAAFGKRRKTLHNALQDAKTFAGMPKQAIADILSAASISPQSRGETLTLQDFSRLAHACAAIK